MDGPTEEELDAFIRDNAIDDRAAADLKECNAEIQRKVLARGELSTARNPSAALLARIRDARVSTRSSSSSGGTSSKTGAEDVESFIKGNQIDESAADSLRSSSPTIQRIVLARGELSNCRNPSSALLARIRDARHAPRDEPQGRGPPPRDFYGSQPHYAAAPAPSGYPPPASYSPYSYPPPSAAPSSFGAHPGYHAYPPPSGAPAYGAYTNPNPGYSNAFSPGPPVSPYLAPPSDFGQAHYARSRSRSRGNRRWR